MSQPATPPPSTEIPAPSLAIVNARVWTGDTRRPWVDAILIRDGSIALLGSSAEVKKSAGSSTPIIDAKGMMVAPAFMDGGGEGIVPATGRMLRAGGTAELVILDRDITRASPEDIRDTRVMLTMTAGRVIYDRLNLFPAPAN